MVSSECDFEQFVDAIKGMDAYEIIYLADKEATEAWRASLKRKDLPSADINKHKIYQNKLIGLIDYFRQSIGPIGFGGSDCRLYRAIQNRSIQKVCK